MIIKAGHVTMHVQLYMSTRIMSATLRDSSTNVTVLDDSTESITSHCIDSKSGDSTREHYELMPLEKMKAASRNTLLYKMEDLKKRIKRNRQQLLQVMPKGMELSRKWNKHFEYNYHAEFLKIKGNQWSVASKTKDPD